MNISSKRAFDAINPFRSIVVNSPVLCASVRPAASVIVRLHEHGPAAAGGDTVRVEAGRARDVAGQRPAASQVIASIGPGNNDQPASGVTD
jgi:hypothetical protein